LNKLTVLLVVATLVLGAYAISAQDHTEFITFTHDQNELSSYYHSPDDKNNTKGVILFVHGDGEMPYDAYGYYDYIWDHILDAGYAIFSWDKPGVGKSTGNWLLQSMKDRQKEVHTAISFIKDKYNYKAGQIGLMGFSQAGWVVPAVARDNRDVGFIIGVGFAMNWMDQGWHMEFTRLMEDGASMIEIGRAYDKHIEELAFLKTNPSYTDFQQRYTDDELLMPEDRFVFVKKNFLSDATEDYRGITQPILILLGEEDRNVNVWNTKKSLQQIFNMQDNLKIQMIPNATHSLLKHPKYSAQKPGLDSILKLMWDGENAYSITLFDHLKKWLDNLPQSISSSYTATINSEKCQVKN
jgi:alpha-beta hydrolase superfamily lysophospholipase